LQRRRVLKKTIAESLSNIFRKPVLAALLTLTITCVLIGIVGTSYGKVDSQIIPLTSTVYEQPGQWQTINMRVTAYCPCEICCGEYSDGVTASGHNIQPGDAFVAADTEYPFDTEMIIAGYKNTQPVKVLDRGGAITGNRLDVFFHSHQEALNWGVKYIDVKILR
jgi:3D (Asp-Asp-Asp) domain-containing protein